MSFKDNSSIIVTGGKQRVQSLGVAEWESFEKAIILKIDPRTRGVTATFEYQSPDNCIPQGSTSAMLFKSASLFKDDIYVCTQTEVLKVDVASFKLGEYLTLPCFNDVHHVLPTATGSLLVVVTGLDMVVEVNFNGEIIREWSAIDVDTWSRFSRNTDYRKIPTTKPHMSHPNYVFNIGEDIWVTRFEQKDALCLTSPDKKIPINIERPHDGVVYDDKVYFTTVDGHIVLASVKSLAVVDTIDLSTYYDGDQPLGWCRGLNVISEDIILVGFSRIRPTKFHSNLLWLRGALSKGKYRESLPTRIVLFDLRKRTIIFEIELEEHALNAVFSVLIT